MGIYVYPELGTRTAPTFSVQEALLRCLVRERLFLPPFYVVGGHDVTSSISAKSLNDPVWGKRDREQKDLIPFYLGEDLDAAVGVFKAHFGKTPLLWSAERFSMAAAGIPSDLWGEPINPDGERDPFLYEPRLLHFLEPQPSLVYDEEAASAEENWGETNVFAKEIGPFFSIIAFDGYVGCDVRYVDLAASRLGKILREHWGEVSGGEDYF